MTNQSGGSAAETRGPFLPWWHRGDIRDPEAGMAFSSILGSSCEAASFHWTHSELNCAPKLGANLEDYTFCNSM